MLLHTMNQYIGTLTPRGNKTGQTDMWNTFPAHIHESKHGTFLRSC